MRARGFTLIEVLMFILLLGVIAGVAVTNVLQSTDESRFANTVEEMKIIQRAMIGDTDLKTRGVRTDFGYLGDIGDLPTAIGDLITKPAGDTAWTRDNVRRIAHGWNGPYIRGGDSGSDYTRDAWGNAYIYTPGASPPTLESFGADGANGGTGLDQDITIQIPTNHRTATVHGFLVTSSGAGNPNNVAATIDLFYPDGSGGLVTTTTTSTVIGDQGYFSFANIPVGVRSALITIGATTYGPIIFTVDRANYMIPVSLTETTLSACTTQTIAFQAASSSGLESVTAVNLVVQASAACSSDMTVDYVLANGTATGGADYTAAAGTVTITAGSTTVNIPITINDDATGEADETLTATISNPLPAGVTLGGTTVHTYTILNNDCVTGSSTVTASGVFTVPNFCTSLVIKSWGGGGGGGGTSNSKANDGGGAGYAFTNALAVVGGNTFTVTIGNGGNGGPVLCVGGGTGAFDGGAKGILGAGGLGGGAVAGGAAGAGGSNAGGAGRYGGGGGGAGTGVGENGGQGGAATSVVNDQTATTILIAGGGGGGGGSAGGGPGAAGAGGPGCSGAGGASGNAVRGGGGGGGACLGANTGNGAGRNPSNAAQAGGLELAEQRILLVQQQTPQTVP